MGHLIYLINEDFLPKGINLKNDEFLLWTNYYGNASDVQINQITKNYKNLIIDNCHAFFHLLLEVLIIVTQPENFLVYQMELI